MKKGISNLFSEFFEGERTGGLILVLSALASLLISGSPVGPDYVHFWHRYLDLSLLNINLKYSIAHWVNDGLMTVFFLLVGLEIERELYRGELSGIRNALLPIFAALGGMLVPALIHLSLNLGTLTQSGFGIPMATDIAFSLGVVSLLGNRVPVSLKVLLSALAIIDDLGAILIIAIFYVQGFSVFHFAVAMTIYGTLVVLNRLKVNNLFIYTIGGTLMWFFMLKSGVHATITGVLLAFAIPFRDGGRTSPSYRLEQFLNKPVPFIVLPVFALANTAMIFSSGWHLSFIDNNTAGIILGLVLGKPSGIFIFSLIAVKVRICEFPDDLRWQQVLGMGTLGGIGFTMSIFITNLAFSDYGLIQDSKIAILIASTMAGLAGFIFLLSTTKSIPSHKI